MKKNSKFILACTLCCLSLFFLSCEPNEVPEPERKQAETTIPSLHSIQGGTYETITYRGQQIMAQKIDGEYIIGRDMVVTPDKPGPTAKGFARKVVWPNNTVYYIIDSRIKKNQRHRIYKAIREIQNVSNVRFKYGANKKGYVTFTLHKNPGAAAADYGYRSGEKVRTYCWLGLYVLTTMHEGPHFIKHEIMHVLGFAHEQNRFDRDKFITIHKRNIPPHHRHNFTKRPAQFYQTLTATMDFKSIMMYHPREGAILSRKYKHGYTMTRKDGAAWTPNRTPNLSKGDIASLNKLYPKKTTFKGSIPKWKIIGFRPAAPGKKLVSYRFKEWNPKRKWLEGKTIASGDFGRNRTIMDWERFLVRPAGGNRVKLRIDNFKDKNYFLKVKGNRLTVVKGFDKGSAFEWIPRGGRKFALKIPGTKRYVQANHSKHNPELQIVWKPHPRAWETFEYLLAPGYNK